MVLIGEDIAGPYAEIIINKRNAGTNCFAINPAGLTINVVSITNATCPSTSNGSIVTSVLGGSAPFSYLWSNGSVNANISNVAAGSYTVTVTDANGLSASTSAVITTLNQLPAPLGTVAGQVSVCAGSTGITCLVRSGNNCYYGELFCGLCERKCMCNCQQSLWFNYCVLYFGHRIFFFSQYPFHYFRYSIRSVRIDAYVFSYQCSKCYLFLVSTCWSIHRFGAGH